MPRENRNASRERRGDNSKRDLLKKLRAEP
jgi:hypothetical protein